ncbi:MAG: methyltransferase domain-containing protein [Zoogloeaceae bacterium]|jgi:ADP-heptose:LPS heptosyltransferase/2-polyprenyl-3-methyl-5-hydroxy-6-metoxy-1,4-benzoquinol methylase/Tfp pilus assembly protein PilF|nr:methyltransferase domain-containing protein [Zoogloeaceae bacterium]
MNHNVAQTSQSTHIGTTPAIESLQIYTASQAEAFQRQWQREVDYIRFEWVVLPDSPEQKLALDLTLRSHDGQHALAVFAVLVKNEDVFFPSILQGWDQENIAYLAHVIHEEIQKGFENYEVRACHPNPLVPEKATLERSIPTLEGYLNAIHHIKRYTFILNLIRPGNVLECACGAGYGAVILSHLGQITQYHGVDLFDEAVAISRIYNQDARFSFRAADLAESAAGAYQNVISLETIEHVPNPYRFIELLSDKIAPEGQLLLSLPAGEWCGSHNNPHHFSNWNRKRLMTFLAQYFEDVTVFTQKIVLRGSTFELFDIVDTVPEPDVDNDEDFVCVLRRPHKRKRPNIVLRRSIALGDVIWMTPILQSLRRLFPSHNLVVWTMKTEVFLNNPDADLVVSMQYEPLPDDIPIDLDWVYEKRRDLHILHAYVEASGVPLISAQPVLYPTLGETRASATRILHHFQQRRNIERLLAVHMPNNAPNRIWPQAHWRQFIADLLRRDKKLGIVVLGHGRDFSAADIGFGKNQRVLCLARWLSLMHTAATLSLCDLLVAPDSGVLHIAAAVRVPYLGLFNITNPATRLPFTTESRAVWADIECRGCLHDIPATVPPHCPREQPICMERILPEEVLNLALKMLESALPGRWEIRCLMALQGTGAVPSSRLPPLAPLEQGIWAFNDNDYENAVEYLSVAMTEEPENPLPTAYLAFICAQQGFVREARDFIEHAVKLAPDRADLIAALGEMFLKGNHPAAAAEYLREALHIQPDLFAAYPALAQSLHLTGQSAEAITLLQTASMLPSDARANIQETLMQIRAECGDGGK